MQQSNAIFAALIIAWIVFITLRGELPTYISLLKGNSPSKDFATGAVSGAVNAGNSFVDGFLKGFANMLPGGK